MAVAPLEAKRISPNVLNRHGIDARVHRARIEQRPPGRFVYAPRTGAPNPQQQRFELGNVAVAPGDAQAKLVVRRADFGRREMRKHAHEVPIPE
jgi:hypothetical protein